MNITGHTVEKVEDTTGIIVGDRYEFFLNVEVEEDDELYSENGLYIKVILAVDQNETRVVQYQIHEKETEKYIDLALEDDEVQLLHDYCKQHIE
jgi:hypothetical protein